MANWNSNAQEMPDRRDGQVWNWSKQHVDAEWRRKKKKLELRWKMHMFGAFCVKGVNIASSLFIAREIEKRKLPFCCACVAYDVCFDSICFCFFIWIGYVCKSLYGCAGFLNKGIVISDVSMA